MSTNNKEKINKHPPIKTFVLPLGVEEEAKIDQILYFNSSKLKMLLFYLISVLTIGLPLLFQVRRPSLKIRFMYKKCHPKKATLVMVIGADKTREYIHVKNKTLYHDGLKRTCKSFDYRLYTYYFEDSQGLYCPIEFHLQNKTCQEILREMGKGIISEDLFEERKTNYGLNSTEIPRRSNLNIILHEILSPFYLFQIFAIIIWAAVSDYQVYAGVLFLLSSSFIVSNFLEIKRNYRKLREKSHYETQVKVYRLFSPISPQIISSDFLIPGDLIEITDNWKLPCDVILLSGHCVMNESLLTGESVPCIKYHLPNSRKVFDENTDREYILYSGTDCLETKSESPNTPVLGVVVKTGFSTAKGKLVRSYLYSRPEIFKFYRDTAKYIGVMAIIALICFIFALKGSLEMGLPAEYIFIVIFALITTAVPPALPTFLAIGSSIASYRLEKQKIAPNSQRKINVAGKIEIMCFDKTGTLTEESLSLAAAIPVSFNKEQADAMFQPVIKENLSLNLNVGPQKNNNQRLMELMATCHSLTYIKGVLNGDPLDLTMFRSIGWLLTEINQNEVLCSVKPPATYENKGLSEVVVIKRFEFSPQEQRMSVIVRDSKEEKQRVYVKGSPEVIKGLCKPETVPNDFTNILSMYTENGLRVLACGTRELDEKVNGIQGLEREYFENGLTFIGFLIFENKLKEITSSIIKVLTKANIPSIMLTGDNPLTSISVAQDCGIIQPNQKIKLGVLKRTGNIQEVEWRDLGFGKSEESSKEESLPLRKMESIGNVIVELPLYDQKRTASQIESQRDLDENQDQVAYILTGESVRYLNSEAGNRESFSKKILKRIKVVARASPEDKALVIHELQKQGYIVGMCGDGANDGPALKIANVGIAISEAEASLAAPFLSKIPNISCVDILLREGRTALVTSFQCFKFQSITALIQSLCLVLLLTKGTFFVQTTFLYIDIFLNIPLTITMAFAKTKRTLAKQQPSGSLISAPVLTSMIGQCIIQAVENQDWFIPPKTFQDLLGDPEHPDKLPPDYVNSALFLTANFQYIATVISFSVGKPFRKPFYTNWPFVLYILVTITASTLLVVYASDNPSNYLLNGGTILEKVYEFLKIRGFPDGFRWIILIVGIVNAIITILFEKIGVPSICTYIFKKEGTNVI